MSLKNRLFQKGSIAALAVLRLADYYISGSNMGRSIEEARRDPHTGYKYLRGLGPVVRNYASRGWLVVGWDAIRDASTDPRFGNDMRKNRFLSRVLRASADGKPVPVLDSPSMVVLDPPDHTRLRRLVSQGFTNRYVQSLAPNIQRIVDECLAGLKEDCGSFDVVEQLARPLPAIVIAEMLGLPESDRLQFRAWAEQILGITAIGQPELIEQAAQANMELVEYFKRIIAQKRQRPGDDIISQLIAAEEEGDRLDANEMYATCTLLLNAGHLTTTSLIGTGLWCLLRHPEQLAQLRANRGLMDNAIEEMLRFEAPVQFVPRFALEPLEFYGCHIKKNQLVLLMIAAANRDEAANPDPDTFDITREQVRHVAFGHGIHLCLGLSLARLEAKIAFNALLDRFDDLELLDAAPPFSQNALVRSVDRLRVRYRRHARAA
ncbi:MAG: cytochrome P450 [Halieaceae bacterium]|nr:cytochrome P450 [Halieaceae bacterium]